MKHVLLIIIIASLFLISCKNEQTKSDVTETTPIVTKLLFPEDGTSDFSDDKSFLKFKEGDRLTVRKLNDEWSKWTVSQAPD